MPYTSLSNGPASYIVRTTEGKAHNFGPEMSVTSDDAGVLRVFKLHDEFATVTYFAPGFWTTVEVTTET